MRLTVVGSAAAWARGPGGAGRDGPQLAVGMDAASSCYLVEHGRTALALDMGQGGFAALRRLRPPETLTAVLVSHPHPDHCVDLIPLRHYLRYEASAAPGTVDPSTVGPGTVEPSTVDPGTVALHAAADLPGRFDVLFGEQGFLRDLHFVPLEAGARAFGTLRVEVAPVTHTAGSFAFRVSPLAPERGVAGSSGAGPVGPARASLAGLVYSGDCGVADDLLPLLRPGDTLLAEASFGAEVVPPDAAHLDSREAARAARDGGAARLVLTHIQATVDPDRALQAARAAWEGETLLARPGLVLEV